MGIAITYKLSGRLGNHLQLWACARTLSLRSGWKFIYNPILYSKDFRLPSVYQGRLFGILETYSYALRRKIEYLSNESDSLGILYKINGKINEEGRNQKDIFNRKNILYVLKWNGIFRRVDEFRNVLINELLGDHKGAIPPVTESNQVGVHIRRDDAAHPLPMSYYVNAVFKIKKRIGDDLCLHVFSDGNPFQLGEELSRLSGCPEWRAHEGTPVQDMLDLAAFPNIVTSMSWFSYWSAFLSHDAMVYVPPDLCWYPHWNIVSLE
jgi:hypothetical protein